jgi:Ca-activated chloride channel family protein
MKDGSKGEDMPAASTFRHAALVVLLIISSAVMFGAAFSQQPITQIESPRPTIKLGLLVTDRDNHSVDDVTKDEVQLFEDGKPQTLSEFSKDTRPLQIAIAVDNSGSFRTLLAPALDFVKLIIVDRKPGDETMLIRFISSDYIETAQDFTSDRIKLVDSLKLLKTEMGQSAINDAIYLAVKAVAAHRPSESVRRAVILISDGEDRASYYRVEETVKLLRAKDVQVFIVGIVLQLDKQRRLISPSDRQKAEVFLNKIASESGGRVFFPQTNGDLLKAAEGINHDLHSQYLIEFQPLNVDKKDFRKIEVKITSPRSENLKAIIRSGYFINPPNLDPKEKDKKKPQ